MINPKATIDLAIKALESCRLVTVFNDTTGQEHRVWSFDEDLVDEALEALYTLEDAE